MKYVYHVCVEVHVHAKNKKKAIEVIEESPPFSDVCGCSLYDGCYSLKTKDIVSIEERKNKDG